MRNNTNQSADSTVWTGFLLVFIFYLWYSVNGNPLPRPTFNYMHECQDSLIQYSSSRVFVSIPTYWMYSSVLWTTETVQHTSAQFISTFTAFCHLARRSLVFHGCLSFSEDAIEVYLGYFVSRKGCIHFVQWSLYALVLHNAVIYFVL